MGEANSEQMANTANALYVCAHVREFPAQALLRLRPDWKGRAVAVLDGPAQNASVCARNRLAAQRGVTHGLQRAEAEQLAGVNVVVHSPHVERAALEIMYETAAQFSPRVEDVSSANATALMLDMQGSELLYGSAERMAAQLRAALLDAGFRVSVAASANYDVARVLATQRRGVTIVPPGQEAEAMAAVPIAALGVDLEALESFAVLGVSTCAELASLQESELIAMFGARAHEWRKVALGAALHTLHPMETEFALRESYAFDAPLKQTETLLIVCARMMDCLARRAATHALSLASLTLRCELEGGHIYRRVVRPALPTLDKQFLRMLLHREVAAQEPRAGVLSMNLEAEVGRIPTLQLGLFTQQTTEPAQLEGTLERLKAMVGAERVEGTLANEAQSQETRPARIALRRMRPPRVVHVIMRDDKPVAFRDANRNFSIAAAYGPWRASGCWWSVDARDCEEWDVLASDAAGAIIGCLLGKDPLRGEWRIEALLD